MISNPIFKLENRENAIELAADKIHDAINIALSKKPRARIAVSGGTTPEPVFKNLSQRNIDWTRIDIALVDERWVDINNDGSNEALVRRGFINAKGVNIIGMKNNAQSAFDAIDAINDIYKNLRPFDAILLGMGNDAHTASWFIGAKELPELTDENNNNSVGATNVAHSEIGKAYKERMTITLPLIKECKAVLLLIFGNEKLEIFENALNDNYPSPIKLAYQASLENFSVFWSK